MSWPGGATSAENRPANRSAPRCTKNPAMHRKGWCDRRIDHLGHIDRAKVFFLRRWFFSSLKPLPETGARQNAAKQICLHVQAPGEYRTVALPFLVNKQARKFLPVVRVVHQNALAPFSRMNWGGPQSSDNVRRSPSNDLHVHHVTLGYIRRFAGARWAQISAGRNEPPSDLADDPSSRGYQPTGSTNRNCRSWDFSDLISNLPPFFMAISSRCHQHHSIH